MQKGHNPDPRIPNRDPRMQVIVTVHSIASALSINQSTPSTTFLIHHMVPTPSSPERASAIATLRAATGLTSDAEASALLTASSWNLDRAASLFLDNSSPTSPSLPTSPPPPQPPNPAPSSPVSRAIAPPHPPLPRWLLTLLSPIRLVWAALSSLSSSLLALLAGPARAIDQARGETDVERFVNFYEERYGQTHPEFYQGTYMEALAEAGRQLKFLLVYLHAETHQLTPRAVGEVINAQQFVQGTSSFVVWGISVTQREGIMVQNALRVTGLPYLAVVMPPSGTVAREMDRGAVGTLLAVRLGGGILGGGADGAARWLERVTERHGNLLDEVRQRREERERDRLLREEQDEEYRRALEEDREKEREAERERERSKREEEKVREREERRERKREQLGMQPEKGVGVASLAMRLPSGEKVERRFHGTDALEKVFDWAEVHRVDIEVACLVCTFPRRSFRYPEDAQLTVQEAGMFPSVMLMLEERVDEE